MKHTPQQSSHDIQDRQLSPRPIYNLVVICLASILTCDYAVCETRQSGIGRTELEVLREGLVKWSMALKSFAGPFTVTRHATAIENGGSKERSVMHIEYRFQDGNRYIAHEMPREDGATATQYDALLNGTLMSMHVVSDGTARVVSGILGQEAKHWTFPKGALFLPEQLFGQLSNLPPLCEFLSEGQSSVSVRDGKKVFTHLGKEPDRLDIWLNEADLPERMEYSMQGASEDEIKSLWPGDAFDVRWVIQSLELDAFKNLGGVEFPTFAKRVNWRKSPSEMKTLGEHQESGQLSDAEYFVKLCTEVPNLESSVEIFNLDEGNTRINEPLAERELTIAFPPDAILFEAEGNRIEVNSGWFSASAHILLLAVVLLAVLILGGRILLIRGKRKRRGHRASWS